MPAVARGIEINFESRFAGDVDTYGEDQTDNPTGSTSENKNGSSNHDSFVVRVNGIYERNFGPQVADTADSYSWNLGAIAGHSAIEDGVAPAIARYGFLNQANDAWMDGCAASGNDEGFEADTSADVRVFNCAGSFVTATGGTHTDFTPT